MPSIPLRNFLHYPWERLALFFFILTLPLSVRNVLWDFSPTGFFNEYTDISLYLSDITLALFVLVLLLRNSKYIKSSLEMFHVEHFAFGLIFLLWAFVTIFWAERLELAVYSFLKIGEGYILLLSLYLLCVSEKSKMFHVEQSSRVKSSTWNIFQVIFFGLIISGFVQAIIALMQFLQQKSIGLYSFGESYLSKEQFGVAKIFFDGDTLIRAYGLFPHPNILGGFLAVTLLTTLAYPLIIHKKMFHVEHWKAKIFWRISIFLQFLALISAFSKSAVLGFLMGSAFLVYQMKQMFHVEQKKRDVPRGTKTRNRMFHVERFILIGLFILLITAFFQGINRYYFFLQPWQERLLLLQPIFSLEFVEWVRGVGIGQYVGTLVTHSGRLLESWQFQPIHNVPAMVLIETGTVGLLLFLSFLLYSILDLVKRYKRNVPRRTFSYEGLILSCLVALIVPFLTDHYLWDIQQGILLFWLVLGLATVPNIDK